MDITERLSRLANWGGNATHLDYEGAILDAKAEIERLRAALREIAEHADLYGPPDQGDAIALIHVARRALENQ